MHPNYSVYISAKASQYSLSFTSSAPDWLLWGQKSSSIYHFVFPRLTWCLEWEDAALITCVCDTLYLSSKIFWHFIWKVWNNHGILSHETEKNKREREKKNTKNLLFSSQEYITGNLPLVLRISDNLSIWSSKGNLLGGITDSCGV